MTELTGPTTPIRIFIASSGEALGIAENLKQVLEKELPKLELELKRKDRYREKDLSKDPSTYEIEVWTSVFPNNPSEIFVHILHSVTIQFDFAIVILTPDHEIMKDGQQKKVANSNVVLEMGLFIGSWGLNRVLLVETKGADLDISDLRGIELALLTLPDPKPYEPPERQDLREAHDKVMQDALQNALRRDVAPCMATLIHRTGKRCLSAPLEHIVDTTRKLETLYREDRIVDKLFLRHLGRHMETACRKCLEPALIGELELLFSEHEGLADILNDAKKSARAVAHYTNIEWWNDTRKIERYIEVHKHLLEAKPPVDIQRIFLLPVMSLLDPKVQSAIKKSCKLGVDVRLLLWRTDNMKRRIKLEGKSHQTKSISYPRDIDKTLYPALPGWSGTIDDELSFLIVDKQLVSYSNIPARDRDDPSRLFTNRPKMHSPKVFDVMSVFERFSYRAIPAEDLFPSFRKGTAPRVEARCALRPFRWLSFLAACLRNVKTYPKNL